MGNAGMFSVKEHVGLNPKLIAAELDSQWSYFDV